MNSRQKIILALVSLLLLTTITVFHIQASQHMPFDHDEQHVATGALLARQGLVPYQDYPYMHFPYLAPVLGAVYSQWDHLLSAGRVFNAACGAALLALVYVTVWLILKDMPFWLRLMVSAATAVYMVMNALFAYSSGKVDNHDPSLLLAFGAFLLHLRGMRLGKNAWFLLSGIVLGLAAGLRLTMLPMAGALLLTVLFPLETRPWKSKLAGTGLFLSGLAAALLPALILIAVNNHRAFFYTFLYNPEYNAAYWLDRGGVYAIGVLGKLAFLLGETIWTPVHYPPLRSLGGSWWGLVLMPFAQNGGIFLGLALMLYQRRLFASGLSGPWPQLRRLTLWMLPFVLVAALASTPTFYQYYYPVLPFGLVLLSFGWAVFWREFSPRPGTRKVLVRSLVGFSLASLVLGSIGMVVMTAHWAGSPEPTPPQVSHMRGREIRSLVDAGKVLTLDPVSPLEGGLEIYPQLATGPFFWRVAHLIDPAARRSLNIVGPGDLESLLAHDPPAAILTGFEGKHENALLEYARRHGYRPRPLAAGGTLHLPGGVP